MTGTRERARRFLIRALSRIHARAYRISGGRILGSLVGMPVLLLMTTGRESGKPRTATLVPPGRPRAWARLREQLGTGIS